MVNNVALAWQNVYNSDDENQTIENIILYAKLSKTKAKIVYNAMVNKIQYENRMELIPQLILPTWKGLGIDAAISTLTVGTYYFDII